MYKLKIMFDYSREILWLKTENDGWTDDDLPFVEDDETVKSLVDKIYDLYWNYIEYDSHGEQVWWNEEGMRKNKQKMLALLKKLNDRLNEINDGSFIVEDLLTPYWEKL